MKTFSHQAALGCALAFVSLAPLHAGTYSYTITDSTTDLWTDGTNWDATPVSEADTNLVFGPTGAFAAASDVTNINTNDFVTSFQLNTLTLQGTGPNSVAVTTTIAGGSLEFVNSSTNVGPQINLTASHDLGSVFYAVNSDLLLTNTLTITGNGTAGFSFGGAISGPGGLVKSGLSTVVLTGANSYGATTVNDGTLAIDNDGMFTFGTLGNGAATLNGATDADAFGGSLEFRSSAIAGSTITANGGSAAGASGSSVAFFGDSTAGAATLTINGGTNDGYAASIGFYENSLGGMAAIELNDSGTYLDISFHNGSLTIGSLAGSGSVYLGGNTLVVGSNNGDTTFSGALQDGGPLGPATGSFTKTGTGTLTLAGDNSYTGDTAIEDGTLELTGTLGGGDYLGAIVDDGVLNVSSTSDQIFEGVISGSGSLVKDSSGKLTLTADNTFTGGTTITGGTLQLGNDTATGSVAGDITDNGSLVFNHSNALEYAGVISGNGSVMQSGSDTLTLSGANTYTGATTVSAGTLALSNDNRLSASTTISITGGATLDLGGHSQTVAGLGSAGNGLVGTITAGTITTTGDAYISSGTFSNALAGEGRLYIGGSSSPVNLNGTNNATTPGHDQVIIGGSSTGTAGIVKLGNANALAAATENVHLWAGVINLNGQAGVRANSIVVEDGDASAIVNLTTASTASFAGGVTLVTGMTQIGGVGDIELSGIVSGDGGFTKTSSGTFTLSASDNTYTGNTEILAGAIVVSGTLASGDYHGDIANAGALTLSAPTADQTLAGVISGTGSLTKSGTGTLTLSAANTYTGATTIGAGTLEVTGSLGTGLLGANPYPGAIANSGTLAISSSTNQTLNGIISGVGTLTKSGTGTLTLGATNTYAGGTVLNGGTLGLGADNALGSGTLTINGGNIRAVADERTLTNDITLNGDFTLGRLTNLSGAIALTNDITITSGNPDSVEPVSSTLSGVISGAHSLTFTDGTNPVGNIVLAGNNTYTGDTTLSSGSLLVTGTLGSGNYLGAISNSGSLTFSLSAAQIFAGAISNSGDLTFSSSAGLTLSGAISGNGSFTKNGSGSLTLSGANTYTGGTTIAGGLVTFSSLDSFGTGNISLNGGGLKWAAGNTADISSHLNPIPVSIVNWTIQGTILDTNGNNVSFASALSFADGAALIKTGAGALTLSGATGAGVEFDVVDGTLAFGTGAYQGSLYIGFSNYNELQGNGPSAVTLSGADTSFSSSETMISSGNEFSSSLTISGGASFSNSGYTYVGYGAIAESTLTVTGSGSTFTGSSYLLIGGFASGRSTFIVSDGASATTQNTILGDFSAGENLLTVSGTGSTFTTIGNLYIGSQSPSGQLSTNSAAMTVSGGASASAVTTVIGRGGAISANSLTITGTGSKFTNTGSLTLAAGAADNGTLNLGSAAGTTATAGGILDTATVTGGLGAAVLQFNTTGTDLVPTYFTRDGTSSGTGVNTTGGLSIVNTAGTTILSGIGTHTGKTTINGGTLVVPQLANGGSASSIGQSSSAATNLVLNGGALRYTGAAQSTDRLFQVGGTTAGGTGTLDASGTGALNFTNTGSIAYGTADQTRTLGLAGTNTDANTLAAVIANNGTGVVGVAKSGPGTWALTGTNTYTGGTTITGGLVSFTTGANLGTGNITLNGGGLLWPSRTLIDISSRLNPIGAGGATFAFDGAYNNFATFSTALTGAGGITKEGIGTLYLAAANTYLGTTTIRDGEVGVLNNGVTTFGTLGSGLTTVGEGRYAGLTFYDEASAGNGTFIANVGATIYFNGTSTASHGTFTMAGGTVSDGYGADLGFQHQATAGSANITLNGATAAGAFGSNLYIADAADLGTATITVNGGTNGGLGGGITFYNDATGGTATVKLYGNGFLDLTNSFHSSGDFSPDTANNVSIGSLEGDGRVLLGGGLTVGTNNASTVFSGVIQDGTLPYIYTPDYSLTKTGTGTLTLSGTNTYSGGTTINGGKLIVDGSTVGTTTINGGGTLGGHGTVGSVTINSGGKISPGNSPGTMTTGNETWNGGGSYVWEINDATGTAGTSWDLLSIGGSLNIAATGIGASGTFTIYVTSLNGSNVGGNPALNFNPALDQSWVIATTTGDITGYSDGKFAIETSAFFNSTGPNSSWHLSVVPNGGGNNLVLTYTAIPEPGAWGAIGIAALLSAILLQRRRQRQEA